MCSHNLHLLASSHKSLSSKAPGGSERDRICLLPSLRSEEGNSKKHHQKGHTPKTSQQKVKRVDLPCRPGDDRFDQANTRFPTRKAVATTVASGNGAHFWRSHLLKPRCCRLASRSVIEFWWCAGCDGEAQRGGWARWAWPMAKNSTVVWLWLVLLNPFVAGTYGAHMKF